MAVTNALVIGSISAEETNWNPLWPLKKPTTPSSCCSLGWYRFRYSRSMHSSSKVTWSSGWGEAPLGVDADGPEREVVGAAPVDPGVEDHPPVGAVRATGEATAGGVADWWRDPGPAAVHRCGARGAGHQLVDGQVVAAVGRCQRDGSLDDLAARSARLFRRGGGGRHHQEDSDGADHNRPLLAHACSFLGRVRRAVTVRPGEIVTSSL